MNPLFALAPFSVHEAEIALFHAWPDGTPIHGPVNRHLQSGLLAKFRAGLKIRVAAEGERTTPFADWRMSGRAGGRIWTIETSAPLGTITDGNGELSSLPQLGTGLILVIRFYNRDSGQWRVHQFHDGELVDLDSAESGEIMMTGYRFRASWQEVFGGDRAGTVPSLEPRMVATIEWHHSGRSIPCWHYDAETDAWTENEENRSGCGDDEARYVSMAWTGGDLAIRYLTPRTQSFTISGHDRTALQWIDARAIQITASRGLTLEPGWMLQTAGCPEPITLPPSGRHWEHPVVRFRFLGRLYATLAHGIFALPALDSAPTDPPFDFPIRLGRLTLLPHTGYLTA